MLIQQCADEEEILVGESLAKGREALSDCLHLFLIGRAIDWDELTAHLNLSELGSELGSFDEEAALVKPSEKSLEGFLLVKRGTFEPVEEVEERLRPQVVASEAFMHGVPQCLDQLEHVLQIEEVEAEGVLLCRLVEVATVETVPESDVCADLGGEELGETTHAGHRVGGGEPMQEVLSHIGLDWLEELDLVLVDEDPDDSEVHVQVAHHLSSRDQLGNGVVADPHVGLVSTQGDGAEQSVLGEGVLAHLVRVLHSGEGGEACFELGLQVGIVEDPQGTGVDVIDNRLLHVKQEGLALIDEYLRDVLIKDDRALDGVLREILQLDVLVKLSLNCHDGSLHLVGLDFPQTVLSTHISAETDEVIDLGLQLPSAALLEVFLGHIGDHAEGVTHTAFLKHETNLLAVVHLLPQFLGELLHQSGLHRHQLAVQLWVPIATHVDGDDQLLDACILGLEVFQADFFEGVQHLVVLLCVLHHRLEGRLTGATEYLALTAPCERTGHREIGLTVAADHIADCPADLEPVGFKSSVESAVTRLHTMVAHLSVSHQDDAGELLSYDLDGHVLGACSACTPLGLDALLHLLLGGETAS